MPVTTEANISLIRFNEQGSNPPTPAAGFSGIFMKADGLYVIDDEGLVTGPLTKLAPAVVIDPLTDTRNIIEPAGDFIPLTLRGSVAAQTKSIFVVEEGSADTAVLTITGTGAVTFQNFTDSGIGFRIMDKDGGTPVFVADTTNERIGVGITSPLSTFDMRGIARLGDGSADYLTIDAAGNTWWVGGAGLVFGHMYIPGVDIVVSITDANPTEVKDDGTTSADDGWSAGELNLVTFPGGGTEHYLTVTKAGKYEVNWDMSISMATPAANIEMHGGVMIDGTAARDKGEAHRTIANNTDTGNMGGNLVIDCPNGTEEISLWVLNADNNNNITVQHGNMNIKLIGGT